MYSASVRVVRAEPLLTGAHVSVCFLATNDAEAIAKLAALGASKTCRYGQLYGPEGSVPGQV